MPGGNRKRDYDTMNENESTQNAPPLKRSKQKCTWCERERERNDLCNRCRQKVESRAKKLLEQKIIGDHHVVKDTLEFIRENVAVSQMRGLDVLQCLEDLFPAKFLLSVFDKQYKGKKGNDVFSCPDRVLRIIVPDMIPTASSGDTSSMNRDALKAIVKRRVDNVLSEWQNRDLSSFDVTMSRPGAGDAAPMNDPSLVTGDDTQSFLRKVALASWSTQNVASFLESCGVRPQVIMQSLRISNSLNITGRKFIELSDEDLRVKWQLADHSAAEILRHRCCYLWCCEKIVASNRKTMPNGVARFPIPLGFHGSSYDRLEKQLRLYGLRLIAITSSYDPMSLVNKIPHSLRFGIDIIVAQGESHVLTEMISKFCDCHALPSAALVRHSVHNGPGGHGDVVGASRAPLGMGGGAGMGIDMGMGMNSGLDSGYGVGSDYGGESLNGSLNGGSMPPEVMMDMSHQQQQLQQQQQNRNFNNNNGGDNKFSGGRMDNGSMSALSLSPLSGSSISPMSDAGSSRSNGVMPPTGMDIDVTGLPPNGFAMPHLQLGNDQMGMIENGGSGMMRMNGNVGNNNNNNQKMNYMNGVPNGRIVATANSGYGVGTGQSSYGQSFGGYGMYNTNSGGSGHPNGLRENMNVNYNGVQNLSNYGTDTSGGYSMGSGWDMRFEDSAAPMGAPSFLDTGSSNESLLSSSSSVGVSADGLPSNEWQSLMS